MDKITGKQNQLIKDTKNCWPLKARRDARSLCAGGRGFVLMSFIRFTVALVLVTADCITLPGGMCPVV